MNFRTDATYSTNGFEDGYDNQRSGGPGDTVCRFLRRVTYVRRFGGKIQMYFRQARNQLLLAFDGDSITEERFLNMHG